MGGGTIMHAVPQFRNTLNNLSSSSLSTNNTLFCSNCNSELCTKLEQLVDAKEAKSPSVCLYNHVFEPVPSQREIEDAVSALQQFIQAVSSSSTLQQISDSYIVMSEGYKRLYDALQLLQANPAIKKLVVSLSSDKAIWEAVMSNVLHQKLLQLPDSVECRRAQMSEQNELGIHILSWILDIIKGKILDLVESFQSLMNDLFIYPRMKNAATDATKLDEKVRSSFLLSIVILLIVIMARSQRF